MLIEEPNELKEKIDLITSQYTKTYINAIK